ncbi:MAG TPA: GtrA family protein [Candidatus Limihabitans stercoravium]|nr:GtrA family protein [Candidatus Limihabitans stercoravium]
MKKELIRIIKFTLFSISAGVIQLLSETLLLEVFGLKGNLSWIAYLIALVLSVLWNFTFNRKFTFQSANNVPVAMLKVACFYAVFTPLSTLWTHYFVVTLNVNEYIVLIGTMLINFVTEFIYDKFVVFRNSIDTNKQATSTANDNK